MLNFTNETGELSIAINLSFNVLYVSNINFYKMVKLKRCTLTLCTSCIILINNEFLSLILHVMHSVMTPSCRPNMYASLCNVYKIINEFANMYIHLHACYERMNMV